MRNLAIFLCTVAAVIFGILFGLNSINQAPVSAPVSESYEFTVPLLAGRSGVSTALESEGLIKNSLWFLAKTEMTGQKEIQDGTYYLKTPATTDDILSQMAAQSVDIQTNKLENSTDRKTVVQLTIPEGTTTEGIANMLEAKNIIPRNIFLSYVRSEEQSIYSDYEFLPDPLDCEYGNLSNCILYYLEGYLYPDTYDFFENSEPEEVVRKMLNNFDTKVWSGLSASDKQNFAETMTLASMVEGETGRPLGVVDAADKATLEEERRLVAGVFMYRVSIGNPLGSDPTVTYGTGAKLCQEGQTISDCDFLNELPETLYNTYDNQGLPIGPINNPSVENIMAALEYEDTELFYFVADKSGTVYFGVTDAEHQANIALANSVNTELGL